MTKTTRTIVLALLSITCIGAASFAYLRHRYPYGMRGGILPQMSIALRLYADDHGGRFPAGRNGPLESLSLLYPDYAATPLPLAGLSGDVDRVTEQVRMGKPLTEADSSWMYVTGQVFRTNSRGLLLWERSPGICSSGRRTDDPGGHAVVFCDGRMSFIAGWEWPSFLSDRGLSENRGNAGGGQMADSVRMGEDGNAQGRNTRRGVAH